MKSEDYRSYLVECVKTAGNMLIDMADDIAGKTNRITNLNISVAFDLDSIPEITITRSHIPDKEALERLFNIREKNLKRRIKMDNECIARLIKPGHEIVNEYQNMRVKDLKHILEQLPDDMAVIIPVIDEEDANHIYGFRHVRTAGVLISEGECDREVLCLNAAADGQDIADQVRLSGKDIGVKSVLFGCRAGNEMLNKLLQYV